MKSARSARYLASNASLPFKNAMDITLAMQNPDHMEGIFVESVVNPDSLKSCDCPVAKTLELGVGATIARAGGGMAF